jgi:hypothetical protein
MRCLPGSAVLAATLALARTAAAQEYDRPDGPGGSGNQAHHGHRGGGPGGMRRMAAPDPIVLHGPPAPPEFARIVELPADQVERYAEMYDRLMTTTRPQRDSLETLSRDMREAFESRDRASAERQRAVVRPLVQELERRQAAFDGTLRDLLEQSQWKRYERWRDDERKRANDERRDRRRGQPDSVPPA